MALPIGFFKEEPVEEKKEVSSSTEEQEKRLQLQFLLFEARMLSFFMDKQKFVEIVKNKIFENKLEAASVTLLAEIVYNMENEDNK